MLICSALALESPGEDSLDFVHYTALPGWKVTDPPGLTARFFSSTDAYPRKQVGIALGLRPPKERLDFRAEFDDVVKTTVNRAKVLEPGEVTTATTRQGFDSLSQTVVSQSPDGQKVYMRFTAAKVDKRLVSIVYFAPNRQSYDKHQRDLNDFLGSVSFVVAGAAGATAKERPPSRPLRTESSKIFAW